MKISKYYNSSQKRAFDLSLALALLIVCSPLLLITYVLILYYDGPPVFYTQKRLGKNKNPFMIYKFRTMKPNAEKLLKKFLNQNEAPYPMFKIADDPRFTTIGKRLSHTGIDEIPQLINIIKGEMSFIGPRPLPINQAKKLSKSWDFRYETRPGILSKWALSEQRYKSLRDWKQIEKRDLANASIASDLHLIFVAIKSVFIKNLFT